MVSGLAASGFFLFIGGHALAFFDAGSSAESSRFQLFSALRFGKFGLQSGVYPTDGDGKVAVFEARRFQTSVCYFASELTGEGDIDVHAVALDHKLSYALVA